MMTGLVNSMAEKEVQQLKDEETMNQETGCMIKFLALWTQHDVKPNMHSSTAIRIYNRFFIKSKISKRISAVSICPMS